MHLLNTAILAVIAYTSGIAAHGIVEELEAGGKSMTGYRPHAWTKTPTAGWSIPKDHDHGFLRPNKYQDPDIICHVDATPGQLSLTVVAGDSIGLQWTDWPEGHHGDVVNYLANCHGKCEDVDKTKLRFNKIDERGLIHSNPDHPIGKPGDGVTTGYWATDELRKNGNKAWFKVPEWVAPGNYVLRHELMALQSAMITGTGIQHYPQCINLIVTGQGSDNLESGTLGTDLYRKDQPGVVVNIFRNPGESSVPGPEVYVPQDRNLVPKKPSGPSASSAKTSKAPRQKSSAAPLGESSSVASVKTAVPQMTFPRGGYQSSTIVSSLPQNTNLVEPSNQASYEHTGVEATKSAYGSVPQKTKVPAVKTSKASNSGKQQHHGAPSKSHDYDCDLSTDIKSSSSAGGISGGAYASNVPKSSTSGTHHSGIAQDAQAGDGSEKATEPSSITVLRLLDLMLKALKEIQKKLQGKGTRKRHARGFGF